MSHVLTTALTTTPPVTVVSSGLFFHVISDSGSFPDRVSSKLGSARHGSTPPLMLRGSGGVPGSVSVPQQQPPSSVPPLAYANYAMGSPQVGFLFRVEPPIICILYMSGVHAGVCFLLGCHIHLWGLNH